MKDGWSIFVATQGLHNPITTSSHTHTHNSVFASFKEYVAVEKLDGENKYDAGEHGLQVTWVEVGG